jgi:hypothetical protein
VKTLKLAMNHCWESGAAQLRAVNRGKGDR